MKVYENMIFVSEFKCCKILWSLGCFYEIDKCSTVILHGQFI